MAVRGSCEGQRLAFMQEACALACLHTADLRHGNAGGRGAVRKPSSFSGAKVSTIS